MIQFSLKGKTAIVSGGAKGIGNAISKKFAQQGASVHVLEINIEKSTNENAKVGEHGGSIKMHQCNVASAKEVEQVVDEIISEAKTIDILVNNALSFNLSIV